MSDIPDPEQIEQLAQHLYDSGVLFTLVLLPLFGKIPTNPPRYNDLPKHLRSECCHVAEYILTREAALLAEVRRLRERLEDFAEIVELGQVRNPDPAFAEWLTETYALLGLTPTPPEESKRIIDGIEQAMKELPP